MFFGYYEHNLDDKNRLMIPSKLKEGNFSTSQVFAVKGFDGCLALYPEETFNRLLASLNELSFMDKEARTYLRILLSSVFPLNIDKLGRIQLPTLLLNKHNIKKEVIVLGVGDHFEIWDKALYLEYQDKHESLYEDVADQLVKKDGRN